METITMKTSVGVDYTSALSGAVAGTAVSITVAFVLDLLAKRIFGGLS